VRKTRIGLFEVVQHCAAGPLQTYQNTEYRRLTFIYGCNEHAYIGCGVIECRKIRRQTIKCINVDGKIHYVGRGKLRSLSLDKMHCICWDKRGCWHLLWRDGAD